MNGSIGETEFQFFYQLAQCVFLGWSTRIFWDAEFVKATDVADADGLEIVPLTVRPSFPELTTFLDSSVKVDNVVITNLFPTSASVPHVDVVRRDVDSFLCRAAVDNYLVDFSIFYVLHRGRCLKFL